jgi:hypothetical protein
MDFSDTVRGEGGSGVGKEAAMSEGGLGAGMDLFSKNIENSEIYTCDLNSFHKFKSVFRVRKSKFKGEVHASFPFPFSSAESVRGTAQQV